MKKGGELIVPKGEERRRREISSPAFFITIIPLNNVPSGETPDGVIQSEKLSTTQPRKELI